MLTDDLNQRLQAEIDAILPAVIDLRHRIHAEPEIGFAEHATRAKLADFLAAGGLPMRPPMLETDIIAELPGASSTVLALRADIDALPIHEQSGAPYASRVPGMMHACGHDGHCSMLAGAARVLAKLRDDLPVGVRFVFQPAEEMVAGGAQLIAAGACEGAVAAYALHGWPGLPLGSVSCKPGALFAAADFYRVTVHGKGGHAAMPLQSHNPNIPLARIALAIQAVHDRVFAETGAVISVSSIRGGEASNVIPDSATIEGTIRYLDPKEGDALQELIRAAVGSVTRPDDPTTVDLHFESKYSYPVVNDAAHVELIRQAARAVAPAGYYEAAEPTMGAEDFAFFLIDRPGAMFWLGLGRDQPALHNPAFNFPDAALATGIHMFCRLVFTYA